MRSNKKSGQQQNMNHLLNFYYENQRYPELDRDFRPRKKVATSVFKKEYFLRANFRFRLRSAELVHQHYFTNPEANIPWKDIVFVIQDYSYKQLANLSCSICLDEPCAPQILPCGHIFCWPCIQHHLGQDETPKLCPLCNEPVNVQSLRPVEWNLVDHVELGSTLEMCLMRKPRGSAKVEAVSSLFDFIPSVDTCTWQEYKQILQRQKSQLNKALDCATDQFELCYLEMCLGELESTLQGDCFEESMEIKVNSVTESDVQDYVYFYQSCNGQNIFLNALDFRMLKAQFGDCLPEQISGKLLEINWYHQSADTKQRMRFINHLTLSTEFALCELNLEQVVSPETLAMFSQELEENEFARREIARQTEEQRRETAKPILADFYADSPLYSVESPLNVELDDGFLPQQSNGSPKETSSVWSRLAEKGLGNSRDWEPLSSQEEQKTSNCSKMPKSKKSSRKSRKQQTVLFSNSTPRHRLD